MAIREALAKILQEWPREKASSFGGNQLAEFIRDELPAVIKEAVRIKDPLIVRASPGAGNWADVPWLAILDTEITDSTREGVYPVYLFRADGSGVYLTMGQGTSTLIHNHGRVLAEKMVRSKAQLLRDKIPELHDWDGNDTELRSNSPLGRSYEMANVGSRFYDVNNLPSEAILRRDLEAILGIYESVKHVHASTNNTTRKEISGRQLILKNPVSGAVRVNRLVILTGTSGSGKTQMARALSLLLGGEGGVRSRLIPVGADWTDSRHVMGFVNHLVRDPEDKDKPVYQTTPVVELLLAADKDREHPYFLILDEMNLSHVERYFADFLSKMESGDELVFHHEKNELRG